MFGFDKKPEQAEVHQWSLDQPLLKFAGKDSWTIGDACEGTLIFGGTGSGKTTGSGQAIAMAMLRAGFGGLVLTVKSEETDRWREYMERCGRSDDLIIFSPESEHRFNFLEYERRRSTRGGGSTGNIVRLFMTVMAVGQEGAKGGGDSAFWDKALKQLLRNILDALRLADRDMTLENMMRVVNSAPQSREETESDEWKERSYLFDTLASAAERTTDEEALRTLRLTTEYWLDEFAAVMDSRTRGNIISTFTTTADGFMRGDLHKLFGTTLNITPEETLEGKVIVIDLPEKQFHELGKIAQIVWKICWQRMLEETKRRSSTSRPVMLWIDEAQNFITESEPFFLHTVREKKGCCVYLTQAKSNYLHALGPGHDATVESFLAVPSTIIFHCNTDPETNEWAERVISQNWSLNTTRNVSDGDKNNPEQSGQEKQVSMGFSLSRMPRIFASEFGELSNGGPPDYVVKAILTQAGRRFTSGEGNVIRLKFNQKPKVKNQ
ncbi:MAG: type IV secretory system conjugative DNA transfer family protein [Phycisphaerales bacterium]|nr:type IV secretory system conjugative DNA transfer family protein [Phycisphaerales bacterium]